MSLESAPVNDVESHSHVARWQPRVWSLTRGASSFQPTATHHHITGDPTDANAISIGFQERTAQNVAAWAQIHGLVLEFRPVSRAEVERAFRLNLDPPDFESDGEDEDEDWEGGPDDPPEDDAVTHPAPVYPFSMRNWVADISHFEDANERGREEELESPEAGPPSPLEFGEQFDLRFNDTDALSSETLDVQVGQLHPWDDGYYDFDLDTEFPHYIISEPVSSSSNHYHHDTPRVTNSSTSTADSQEEDFNAADDRLLYGIGSLPSNVSVPDPSSSHHHTDAVQISTSAQTVDSDEDFDAAVDRLLYGSGSSSRQSTARRHIHDIDDVDFLSGPVGYYEYQWEFEDNPMEHQILSGSEEITIDEQHDAHTRDDSPIDFGDVEALLGLWPCDTQYTSLDRDLDESDLPQTLTEMFGLGDGFWDRDEEDVEEEDVTAIDLFAGIDDDDEAEDADVDAGGSELLESRESTGLVNVPVLQ